MDAELGRIANPVDYVWCLVGLGYVWMLTSLTGTYPWCKAKLARTRMSHIISLGLHSVSIAVWSGTVSLRQI